jgi:hypothetical protein
VMMPSAGMVAMEYSRIKLLRSVIRSNWLAEAVSPPSAP